MAYAYEHSPSNPDSKPLYNSSIFFFWNWFDDVWGCNDWKTWHLANTQKYGIGTANSKFLKEWDNLALASSAIDCRTFNQPFRDYFKNAGIYEDMTRGIGVITRPIGAVSDVVDNLGSGLTGASKILKIALPLIMLVVIVIGVMYLTKYTKKK